MGSGSLMWRLTWGCLVRWCFLVLLFHDQRMICDTSFGLFFSFWEGVDTVGCSSI